MSWLRKASILITLLSLISALVLLSSWTARTLAAIEKGYIKGRTRAIVRVYEENANNSKGPLLYSDWIQKDEYVPLSTERGRIIYDYRYSTNDNWTSDVHAWCRGSRDEAVLIP